MVSASSSVVVLPIVTNSFAVALLIAETAPPPASSQATPLPVEVSTCPSEPCAPPTVKLSVSKVPSISASPEISKVVASNSPATVSTPLVRVNKSVSDV